jgi:hypothetical protein
MVRASVHIRGYQKTCDALREKLESARSPDSASRIIWGVRAAARILPGTKCLAQALTMQFMLARAGHESVLRVGVAKDSRMPFDAHAWVIFRGHTVIGEAGDRYTPLADLQLRAP